MSDAEKRVSMTAETDGVMSGAEKRVSMTAETEVAVLREEMKALRREFETLRQATVEPVVSVSSRRPSLSKAHTQK